MTSATTAAAAGAGSAAVTKEAAATPGYEYRLASSESALFAEADEAASLIEALASDRHSCAGREKDGDGDGDGDDDGIDLSGSSGKEKDAAVEKDPSSNSRPAPSSSSDPEEALSSLRSLLDRYLECPTLLDPYLEGMCASLMDPARSIVHENYLEWRRESGGAGIGMDGGGDDGEAVEGSESCGGKNERENCSIRKRRRQRQRRLCRTLRLRRILSAVYALSKVRGRKHVCRFLPHGVDDVEPVLHALRTRASAECSSFDAGGGISEECEGGSRSWESSYSLLLWLGTLSLVPFGLDVIDSSSSSGAGTITLASSILLAARSHLGDPGPTRDAAASCLASLLSRPDFETAELEGFADWSDRVMRRYLAYLRGSSPAAGGGTGAGVEDGDDDDNEDPADSNCVFLTMGAVQALAGIFKTGNRSNLIEGRRLRCVEQIWARSIEVAETASPSSSSSRREKLQTGDGLSAKKRARAVGGGSIQLRKLLAKLFARVGAAYLPPRVAPWRYQRGRRSLLDNLSASKNSIGGEGDQRPNQTREEPNDNNRVEGNGGIIDDGTKKHKDDDEDELFHVPDPVEDACAQLLRSLADPATVVRWSAAKGLGRICSRLPLLCADDVLDALLIDMFSDDERDGAWHGGCLALAELARRGLLLPSRLGEASEVVVRAMRYDVRRGRASVGAHVRDAACYAAWAFARAYAPGVLRPHVAELSRAVVLCALFDREVNCRRAAGAAFQECVGRQGADNFKHGIEILTAANYYSLGNRSESYTSVAPLVASFDEYRRPVIRRVSNVQLSHWDVEVRILSSQALGRLVPLDATHVAGEVLPRLVRLCTDTGADPAARHGAVLGLAEAVLALGEAKRTQTASDDDSVGQLLDGDVAASLAELVPSIERARLYRGRCGEDMRAAVGRFVECLSLSRIPLTVRQQVRLLDSVDDCLKHPNEKVQTAAASALHALLRSYFPLGTAGPSDRLRKRVVGKYTDIVRTDDNPAATRGYALALGKLPRKLLSPDTTTLGTVLACLVDAARVDRKVGDEGDAETRRNAVLSLAAVCEEVGIVDDGHGGGGGGIPVAHSNGGGGAAVTGVGLSEENLKSVFDALLASMDDYNSDRRGDVGSWSRMAAMRGLVSLTSIAVRASPSVPHLRPRTVAPSTSANRDGPDRSFPVPSLSERAAHLESDAYRRVGAACMRKEPFRDAVSVRRRGATAFFDEGTCARMIGALLKQLSEKLDAVRHTAGSCLEEIFPLDDDTGGEGGGGPMMRVPFVPHRSLLLEALNLKKTFLPPTLPPDPDGGPNAQQRRHTGIDWASPADTFPLVMRAVNIDEFFEEIISGVVISVGGLTKTVVTHSTAAFLEWMWALSKSGAKTTLTKLGKVFLQLFDRHHRDGRVITPLLKTIDILLSQGCLDEMLFDERCDFGETLLLKLCSEAKGCSDVKRLLAITSVLIGLLQDRQQKPVTTQTLHFLMVLLAHRYPRVRRATAELLYVKLLEDGTAFANDHVIEEVSRLLLEVAWDKELDPPGNVRECRNRVSDLLGVDLSPEERERVIRQKTRTLVTDTFQSYATLINDIK